MADGIYLMGKYCCGHRAAVSVDVYILVPSTVVRKKKKRKHYLSKARCRRKKCCCAKSVTFSLL